ncbi:Os05g0384025 [Oryza sativa Japonica Group]|uniref:Os05g0384025 protein n=1 Tax=Oryza sativa subsp. japonica TaxID=39947 RepID=A0A0P0WLY3_ORYSJ|nr:Os05g0384025 [Oryza sativa Japonica Group]
MERQAVRCTCLHLSSSRGARTRLPVAAPTTEPIPSRALRQPVERSSTGTTYGADERSSSRGRDAGQSCRGHASGHSMFVQPARLLLLHYWGRDELCPIRIGTNKRGR